MAQGVVREALGANGRDVSARVPVRRLARGERGRVVEVSGREALCRRLREIGIDVGTQLEVVQPGNPCMVRIGSTGGRWGLRSADACRVIVERVADE